MISVVGIGQTETADVVVKPGKFNPFKVELAKIAIVRAHTVVSDLEVGD